MGRKKKVVVEEQPKIEETKPATSSIGYQGTVKVSIQKGKNILSTKIYHNTGKANLFKFICNCLAGNYDKQTRPCRIALFGGSEQEQVANPDKNAFSHENLMTPTILIDTTPIVQKIETENNDNSYYTVTYHFRIPYSYIDGTAIYKAALFSSNPSTDSTDNIINSLYATYKFTKKENTGLKYDPIEISPDQIGNFNIVIEWTMALTNYIKETE